MAAPPQTSSSHLAGAAMCAASAAAFGAMAIFAKLAYDAGVGALTLLMVRFVLAAALLRVLVAARSARRSGRRRRPSGATGSTQCAPPRSCSRSRASC